MNFYEDMGPAPSSKHSVDRINPNKGYSKDNCRWATAKEQANNRTNTIFIERDGTTKTISQWSEELGWPVHILSRRHGKGWRGDLLFSPIRKRAKNKTKLV
jgi:hypothetical protein